MVFSLKKGKRVVSISVRVLWSDSSHKRTAERVVEIISAALKSSGFEVKPSRVYRNKRGSGGRVYITVKYRKS